VVHIDDVQLMERGYLEYRVTGRVDTLEEPKLEFRVHLMDLTSDDKHSLQLDPKHVPKPTVSDRRSGIFNLSVDVRVVYEFDFVNSPFVILPVGSFPSFQRLLENERLLLVLADRDKHAIYIESLAGMGAAIHRASAIKTLNRDKMGEHVLFAYDEAKRTLAVCAAEKVSPMSLINIDVLTFCSSH
jgi:hypothetical protein